MKKYRLLEPERIPHPTQENKLLKVHRIQALRDIPKYNVKAGDIGGFVTSKKILSHDDEGWVADDALVGGRIYIEDSLIRDNAVVYNEKDFSPFSSWNVFDTLVTIDENSILEGNIRVIWTEEGRSDSLISTTISSSRISDNASLKNINVIHNSIIKDYAILSNRVHLSSNVTVMGNAAIDEFSNINGDVTIEGNAYVGRSVQIGPPNFHVDKETTVLKLSGRVIIGNGVNISGQFDITDDVEVRNSSILYGVGQISGKAFIYPSSDKDYLKIFEAYEGHDPSIHHIDSIFGPYTHTIIRGSEVSKPYEPDNSFPFRTKKKLTLEGLPSVKPIEVVQESPRKFWETVLTDTTDMIDSYRSDIVKVISYPLMSDMTNDYTSAVFSTKKHAERMKIIGTDEEFIQAVREFENKFSAAESNARKISNSQFTEQEMLRAQRAQDLFAIALDGESFENERRASFKQGFKQLKGIVDVPDIAVDNLRNKIGLLELEM